MSHRILQMSFLPDLSMPKYGARFGAEAAGMAGGVVADLLALLDHRTDDWVLLRYRYTPHADTPQQRLKIFLRVESAQTPSGKGSPFPGQHLLSEFYEWNEVTAKEALAGMDAKSGCVFQVQRSEELFYEPERDFLYYAPVPIPSDLPALVDKVNLDGLLQSLTTTCVIDITSRPIEMSESEGQALFLQLKELDRNAAAFDPERRDTGSIEDLTRQRDLLASRHREFYQQYFDALYSGRICEFGIRVLSPDRREGSLVASSLAEALAPNGKACVWERGTDAIAVRKALAKCEHFVEKFKLSTGESCYSERLASAAPGMQATLENHFNRAAHLSHLCCLVDMSSAKRLLKLPTSDGIYLRTIRIESELRAAGPLVGGANPSIEIGQEAERPGALAVGLEQIRKHLFIAGVTGSGKTTTILNLLTELWVKHRIPFLVLEPVKSEYRVLTDAKGPLAQDLRIYAPGSERFSPFRFNPLEVPPGVTVEEHISALESCFAGAIPMSGGPLPSLISEAIVGCYAAAGFGLGDVGATGNAWPTMKSLVAAARKIMAGRGYVGEVKANLATAIDVRLNSLCQRSVGRMFSSESSFPSLDALLEQPTVLEMDALNLDQQNLLVLFLLTSIRERLARQGPAGALQHVIVLEEAHNLIGVQSAQGHVSEDFADPRGHAARFLVRFLAEIRAFGEGVMVVDQSPAAIAPDVLKNTSVKVVHRTVSEDDRDALAAAMLMDKFAHEELARLQVGEAFVYNERLYRPTRVICARATAGCSRPEDAALLQRWSNTDWFTEAQEARLKHLRDRLERLLELLRNALVAATRLVGSLGSRENPEEWKSQTLQAAQKARAALKATVTDAMLDRPIQSEAAQLGSLYSVRMQELLDTAAERIREK